VTAATAVWGLLYAGYRAYYGFGGTFGMIGTPRSPAGFRLLNLFAVGVLMAAAVLPVAALFGWRHPRVRRVLLGLCWIVAVGCVMHAVIDDVQRVLSLIGAHQVRYPASEWLTVDRHAADVQDLALNEPWFLIEGLLWGALGWIMLGRTRARRRWVLSALAAIAVLTAIGLLSAFGVVGRFVLG